MSTLSKISEPTPHKVSLSAAATALDVSERTIRRRVADGSLTGYRFGPRLIRVDMAEVDALLSPIPTAQAS